MLSATAILAASVLAGQAGDSATKEHLEDLECLIGTWVCEDELDESATESPALRPFVGKKFVTKATYTWAAGEGAITNDVELDFAGQFTINAKALIGWDPLEGQVVGHLFTNRGGCWTQRWGQQDGNLIVDFEGVNLDGVKQKARWIYIMDGKKSYTLREIDRERDGKALPDVERVFIRQ
jgi:hypothetical protein